MGHRYTLGLWSHVYTFTVFNVRIVHIFSSERMLKYFIAEMQFCRCLDQHLSLRLSEADYEFLVSKYGDKDKSTVNYKAFCKAMEDGE